MTEVSITAYTQQGADETFATQRQLQDAAPGVREFPSVTALLAVTDPASLPDVVRTVGHATPSDGAGLEMTLETWAPDPGHVYRRIGIPLGARWAIPRNISTAARTSPVQAAVTAMLARAQTYVDAGEALVWDPEVLTPLHDGGPTRTQSGLWGLTCSSLVGLVLSGIAYQESTYTAESNIRRDPQVRWGRLTTTDPWQAHRMARWAFTNGDVWIPTAGDWQPGDILFWGKQQPEGPGTNGVYFLNVYHVAIYAGDGMLIQSKSASDPQGVMREPLAAMPDEIVLAWRPQYSTPVGTSTGAGLTQETADARYAPRVETSAALNNRYNKTESDSRYATVEALAAETAAREQADQAEQAVRTATDHALDTRVTALEGNGATNPAVNRVLAGRVSLNDTPAEVANGMSRFNITFPTTFPTVPRIAVTVGKPGTPSSTLGVRLGEVTETAATIWVSGLVTTGWVDWFATDASQLPAGDLSGYATVEALAAAVEPLATREAMEALAARPGFITVPMGVEVPDGTPAGTLVVRTQQ